MIAFLPRTGWILTAAALAATSGCALFRGAAKPEAAREIRMDPVEITADPRLERLNDEELFASGESAFAAHDYKQAARYFDRLVDFHPKSRHLRAATYDAGLAHEKNGDWEEALARFCVLADAPNGTGDALDAAFRVAEVLYHLGRPAEATFRAALAEYQAVEDKSLVDDFYPTQAQFFLGEIYRLRYQTISFDPGKSVDELSKDLEYKAELLLSAQGHYLRAIRMGNGYWATASGERIGGLYENLYEQMMSSPVPKELDAEEAVVYRQELRKKVRILITKAINIYERTLETAERIGAANPFVERTRESLRKMKELLLADAQKDDDERNTN